jgi:uncharacterized protein (TIGR00730 family)
MSDHDHQTSASSESKQEVPAERKVRTADLIRTIKDYAEKLREDGSTRGDLKILSRTLRELRYAFKVFAPYRHRRKVTIFGSARTKPGEPAYQQAVQLGRAMAKHDWMVITGAGDGIMGAGHEGAGREHSMGLNIMLPFEQSANVTIDGDHKLVHMKYFFTRKLMFVKECDAVVCLPGGFGTIDEALEVLTLLQTGKHDMVPVVFLDAPGGTYWKALNQFIKEHLLQGGMISKEDLSLFKVTDSCEEAMTEVMNFYRRYHSMRYVREELVLRLNEDVSEKQLAQLNADFGGIISKGAIRQGTALSAERDEPELSDKPRLIFKFNRRQLGRLRQLIDSLNATMPS